MNGGRPSTTMLNMPCSPHRHHAFNTHDEEEEDDDGSEDGISLTTLPPCTPYSSLSISHNQPWLTLFKLLLLTPQLLQLQQLLLLPRRWLCIHYRLQ